MRPITNRLFSEFRRLDGARTLAFLSTTAQSPTKDQIPYRILVVKSKGVFTLGDVVSSPGGRKILLLETPADHDWAEAYRAAYVSRLAVWQRRTVTVDSVSKVNRDTGFQDMGSLYLYLDKPEVIVFERSIETKYRFLTGQDVQAGDLVDGMSVKRVYAAMGVKAVEVE